MIRAIGFVLVAVAVGVAGAQAPSQPVAGQQGGGQQTSAPAPTGTVTGRVMCTDTQRPARFAQVTLVKVPSADATQNDRRGGGFGGGGGTRTGLDGTFVATNISPGDYYVMASAPGYVPERALVQAAVNAGADPNAIVARLAVVRVSADSSSAVTVQMERGGTIAGRVQWEDGSPASGVQLTAVSTATTVQLPAALQGLGGGGGGNMNVQTDDRGAFRVTGLPAGDYLLHATLRAPVPTPVGIGAGFPGGGGFGGGRDAFSAMPITVYVPGVFHKAQAKPVTVRAGEERDDLRMVINLGSLRKVAGNVSSATAGTTVASGRVTLSDPSDSTVTLTGTILANGDFSVAYVPPGTYTLQVNGSTTAQNNVTRGRARGGTSGASFQPATQTVTVGETDVTGLGITLSPLQAAAPATP